MEASQVSTHPFLAALALFTLIVVAALIAWQLRASRREQRIRGERPGDNMIQAKNPTVNMHGAAQDPLEPVPPATVATGGTGDETTRSARLPDPV